MPVRTCALQKRLIRAIVYFFPRACACCPAVEVDRGHDREDPRTNPWPSLVELDDENDVVAGPIWHPKAIMDS